ncbi:MAG TPA: biotin carboxylase N-terminal domain-containing protein [Gaiellaceae bacterium]|nr:biotin carboxylase N-terminal domain-containing protein [Gaiellaceae bacterium]
MEVRKLLVANRGEIAARIFRTCDRLGIETVAVAAPDDAGALHTRLGGEVREIESYLDPDEHLRAARESGADAIHPGYGFLAESAGFAAVVEAGGLTWVGPPQEVLRAAGDKLEAKRLAVQAGVPTLPSGAAEEVGFPLLVKAAAGGGGRGMRIVHTADELDEALVAARREAKAGFADETVFLERYLERPRHVEVQLLADKHGTIVHLGERDCSVQRRHQKVLEESPAPELDVDVRDAMTSAAVELARELGYVGAGTAEFVVQEEEFFFLELNARIQVEHPVTEAVTGVDLVEQQLRVAGGEQLTLGNPEVTGHAVEARLYAEDPRTFLPQAGRVERLRLPGGVRVDTGIEAGDEVPVAYDPMIAKLVAHADTREEALRQLAAALSETAVSGVTTNLAFLRWLVSHPAVRAGRITTAFLTEHPPLSTPFEVPSVWAGGWRLNRARAAASPPPRVEDASRFAEIVPGGQRTVAAPMPGTVISVLVAEGARVEARQPLLVLEAMKMETPLVSPSNGVVSRVYVAEGDRVAGGDVLIELEG